MKKLMQAQALMELECKILEAAGLPAGDARVAAEVLTDTDLRGINTHGVFRLPLYLDRIRAGSVCARPQVSIRENRLATAVLDGGHGLGQVTGVQAMGLAIEKAGSCGVGLVSVVNGHHFGAGAYFVSMAVQKGMIGLALCNTKPLLAPAGGKAAIVGNNPIAIGIPARAYAPFILDMAFSRVSHGRIRMAKMRGESIPEGWALNREGIPTTDVEEALEGILLSVGGYKGYGLALAVDILAGMLCGAGWSDGVQSLSNLQERQNSGQLYAAVSIEAFREPEAFLKEMDSYIGKIKACPRQEGQEVFYPGERSARKYAENLENGIPVPEQTLAQLAGRASDLGITITV